MCHLRSHPQQNSSHSSFPLTPRLEFTEEAEGHCQLPHPYTTCNTGIIPPQHPKGRMGTSYERALSSSSSWPPPLHFLSTPTLPDLYMGLKLMQLPSPDSSGLNYTRHNQCAKNSSAVLHCEDYLGAGAALIHLKQSSYLSYSNGAIDSGRLLQCRCFLRGHPDC